LDLNSSWKLKGYYLCLIDVVDSALVMDIINILVVDALKRKAIKRYEDFLRAVKKGNRPDYQEILNLICFINLPVKLDNHDFIK
jgi:hypothetical protein